MQFWVVVEQQLDLCQAGLSIHSGVGKSRLLPLVWVTFAPATCSGLPVRRGPAIFGVDDHQILRERLRRVAIPTRPAL